MGVRIRKKGGKWYVFVSYHGRRKAKCVGTRAAAEEVKRQLEARLALGDLGFMAEGDSSSTFERYASSWVKQYAEVECKRSTVVKHQQVLKLYLYPRFGSQPLSAISRDAIKNLLAELVQAGKLARNSIRLILCTLRVILRHAVEDGMLENNPADRLGRFTKTEKRAKQATALTLEETQAFLDSVKAIFEEHYAVFLTAVRAGLRRGEVIALKWGDIQFGRDEHDPNRYILVQRNHVYGEFTSPKSGKSRRVDLSAELRRVLLELKDTRMLKAFTEGRTTVADDLIFPGVDGAVMDPAHLSRTYLDPALDHAGLRKIRFHDLRHTFGSLLIQDGAPLAYVKEQMGHSSIQVTVDTYGHLIPGADIAWVDRLDRTTSQQPDATQAQPAEIPEEKIPAEVIDLLGGPARIRTWDQGIMSPSARRREEAGTGGMSRDNKDLENPPENPQSPQSEKSGKVRQNLQPPRNQEGSVKK